ncbi:MAG: hypothetical protein CSA95_02430 [Bacteroidetes bacterium]|nr:MAG: hypothetical protein CSA95_02430 [Bacteroidota bacterium]
MGTIRKQSVLGTIVVYMGVVVGFVNTGLLLPAFFSTAEIGLMNVLVAYATIFAQFASLGFNSATTRLFPYFRDKEHKHNGFPGLGMSVMTVGFLVCLLVFFLLHNLFLKNGADRSPLFESHINLIIPLYASILLFLFFDNYLKVLYRSTIGLFLREVVQRLFILVSIVLFVFKRVDFELFLYLYIAAYAVPVVFAVWALIRSGDLSLRLKLDFISPELRKELISVSLFGIIAGFMGVITISLDRLMIQRFMGLSATGIYATTFFFGTVVALPARSLVKISTAYLAESWKNRDIATIRSIYVRSSITQLIFGLLVYGGLLINLDNIFEILGGEYLPGRYVIVFIGLAFLSDMAIGVAAQVLLTSSFYRYQTYLLLLFLVLVIVTNLLFIPRWGITGAALASFLSKFIHNILKIWVVYGKIRLQPFTKYSLFALLCFVPATVVGMVIPVSSSLILNIGFRSTAFVVIFMGTVYLLKLSPDLNERADRYWTLLLRALGR